MAKSLNIVIGADIEKLREGFNKAIAVVQSSGKKMSDEVAKSAKSMEERLASIATRNPTMGSVRQLTQLAMEARALGPEFAQVANEIIKQAGRMKDAIGDTRAEVGYFASDTRRLDAVLGGVQGLAGGFAAIQGAAALAGVENKNLQATMVKLQGAMALVSGLQAVQNTLQQESAAVQGALALRTSVLSAAQTFYTTATAGAIGAQRALNIVMAAAPWALAIAAISAIVISIAGYEDKTKKLSAAQKNLNDIQDDTIKNFQDEAKSVSALLAIVNSQAASMKSRKEALAEIQKIYPTYLKNQDLEKVSTKSLSTATTNLTAEILKNARARAASAKLQELQGKLLDIEAEKDRRRVSTLKEVSRLQSIGASPSQTQGYQQAQEGLNKVLNINEAALRGQVEAVIRLATAEDLNLVATTGTTTAINNQKDAVKGLTTATDELTAKNTGGSLLAPVDPIVKQSMADVLAELDKIPPALEGAKVEPLFADVIEEGPAVVATTVEVSDAFKTMADRNSASFQQHASALNASSIKTAEWASKTQTALDAVNAAFAELQMQTAENMAQFIADMATGEEGAGKNFGKNMLGAIAGFMDTLGKALVATAIASEAFQKLLIANPAAAAVAGIALMAGAAIVRNELKKGPNVTAFADGGIVSGPTLGLMGEYPGASSNPEVIAPLDKLKGMLKNNDNSSGFVASTSIQGRDLAIVLERYNRDTARG
jgi:hypothetical protein